MSKKPETVFKDRIYPILKSIPYSWVEKIQQVGKRGTPDFLCCFSGFFVAIELKKDLAEMEKEDSTSTLQNYKLEKIKQAKGIAIKVCPETWPEVYQFLLSIKEMRHEANKKTTNPTTIRRTRRSRRD